MNDLVNEAAAYINRLFDLQLSPDLKFHNPSHTLDVVDMVDRMGKFSKLSKQNLQKLLVAAWFHDAGYCNSYLGHEDDSAALAVRFLNSVNCVEEFITDVVAIINSTRVPQKPVSLLEKIMCDADLAHLASEDYPLYAVRLRTEWELCLNKTYSDQQWDKGNLDLMQHHRYFTAYGRKVLEPAKQKNALLIASRLQELN
ncbi:MAG: HD domain-containing protein [Bacteroidota bacterium]|nr:HD domain-containing protein [Bacteroidota bacterium]